MRQMLLGLMLMSVLCSTWAFSFDTMPESFSIREIKQCAGCAILKTSDGGVLGAIYPLGPRESKGKLTFEFLDEHEQRQALVKFHSAWLADVKFELLDADQHLLGYLHEFLYKGRIEGFAIHAADDKTVLAKANNNVFHTYLTIYEKQTWNVMMELSCPFFSWQRNWDTVKIDRALLQSSGIDAHVFAAVLAIQSLTQSPAFETTVSSHVRTLPTNSPSKAQIFIEKELQKLKQIQKEYGLLTPIGGVSQEELQQAAHVLMTRYQQMYGNDLQNDEEMIDQFVNFTIDLIQEDAIVIAQKKAMLQYVMDRLKRHLDV